ncbi:xyloglucan fucosyltransferase [Marchantia polymorpha subsp. ruderalis]|uniref:Fucosyltransferase n=2 Tax=Marchantia polymorpha TaxID=3197 RepID=A0AAF6BMX5_MARPO|nr:hypothetical protein MARPO_0035s0074 [Marchantia polymorpha]BBN13359.1 hypothetical protein Mp_6g02870 [Marchantia polymorpha subsp. ruderalis]|eukprot:PTQ41287.1 hypothetical protein MARPO_0035s0074 [Marchantia polymorpha]
MAKSPKKGKPGTRRRIAICKLLPFLCLALFLIPFVKHNSRTFNRLFKSRIVVSYSEQDDEAILRHAAPAVQKLVEAIRQATSRASDGEQIEFSEDDRKEWEARHPCRSRLELAPLYAARKHLKDVPANKQWLLVFREYEKLHRACSRRVGDLLNYFESHNTSIGCKFVIAETHFGLGNKLYHVSSVFMFAVLRQRVILVPESTSIPSVVCEPFAGSSWRMNDELHEAVKRKRKLSKEFYAAVDRDLDHRGTLDVYASAITDEWGPEMRFFCNSEQRFLTHVTWLTMDGCLLFLPKLWAIDMFRPALEGLFPDRIAATYVLRSLMLPADHVWERILHVNELYLANAEKQVGIQVRYFGGDKEFEEKNDLVNDRITRCLWENDILPEVCPATPDDPGWGEAKFAGCAEKLTAEHHAKPRMVKVLIASLFQGLQDFLNNIYLRHEVTATKDAVGVYQLTHELIQGTGVEVDSQALVEVISLSLSDVLLVSPMSTFGGVAQAYGGLMPWFIDIGRPKGEPDQCQRAMGIDPCHLGARENYECRYDPPGSQNIYDMFTYLKHCLPIDVGYGWGMELIPDNPSDHDFSS